MITEFHSLRQDECLTQSIFALASLLRQQGLYCATAESCTGGLLGALLTDLPGSSQWFRGGIIAYDNIVKTQLLGVPAFSLEEHGAVSAPVAAQMALGACHALGADMAMALTGVAGPDGGTPQKPVGTVWLGLALPKRLPQAQAFLLNLHGSRHSIRTQAATLAIQHALALLEPNPSSRSFVHV